MQILTAQDFACNSFVMCGVARFSPISLKLRNFGGERRGCAGAPD
jgi:hypothetical protein